MATTHDRDGLKARADALGVSYPQNIPTTKLAELVAAALVIPAPVAQSGTPMDGHAAPVTPHAGTDGVTVDAGEGVVAAGPIPPPATPLPIPPSAPPAAVAAPGADLYSQHTAEVAAAAAVIPAPIAEPTKAPKGLPGRNLRGPQTPAHSKRNKWEAKNGNPADTDKAHYTSTGWLVQNTGDRIGSQGGVVIYAHTLYCPACDTGTPMSHPTLNGGDQCPGRNCAQIIPRDLSPRTPTTAA